MKPRPVAILCADLHLSLTPPACRTETQEEWLDVQAHYLDQIKALRKSLGNVEVFCSGDIFDRWNPSPELINFALARLPSGMLAVPGQHDLMHHRYDLMHKSGYGVLKGANKIYDLTPSPWSLGDGGTFVYGFGWNQPINPPRVGLLRVALIHRYVWTIKSGYPGASEESHLEKMMGDLKKYHVAVFGDNHCPFQKKLKTGTLVWNCGTFIRRKSDEIKYCPRLGILCSTSGEKPSYTIEYHYLDTSIDRFHDRPEEREQKEFDMREFLESLEDLGEQGMNFREAVERHLRDNRKKYNPELARKVLALAWEEAKQK